MAKFQVLQHNQRITSPIFRADVEQKRNQRLKSDVKFFTTIPVILILCFMFSILISSAVRMHNDSYDFTVRLNALYVFIAISQEITIFLSMGVNMQKIEALYGTLQQIVDDEAEIDQIQRVYWRAEQKYRKYSKMIAITLVSYDQSAYLMAFIYSIYYIRTGNADASTWPVVFELSVPFDTKTITGWYLLLLIGACSDLVYLTCFLFGTTQFIGCCMHIAAICEHFDLMMQTVQAKNERNLREDNSRKSSKIDEKVNAGIGDAIQFHVKIYEIFKSVADMNSASIFMLLPPNAVVLGISMYQMHQAIIGGDLGAVMIYILTLICVFLWPFIFCYFATSTTDRMSYTQRSTYDLNWHNFPPKLQEYVILIMAQSQRAVNFDGLKLFCCTLEIFGKLIRSSISYYMAFDLISSNHV